MCDPSDAQNCLCHHSRCLSDGEIGVRKDCWLLSAMFLQSWWPSMTLKWSGLFLGYFLGIQEHKHCFPVPGLSRCTCEVFCRFMILRETDCRQKEVQAQCRLCSCRLSGVALQHTVVLVSDAFLRASVLVCHLLNLFPFWKEAPM